MKCKCSLFLVLALIMISMAVVKHVDGSSLRHVFPDPCTAPGGPYPGCEKGAPRPANPYQRGCSKINRCRGGA